MRLIDADYLLKRLDKCYQLNGIGLEPVMAMRDIKALISVMPEVDTVPVIHGCWEPVITGFEEIDNDGIPAFDCSVCNAMCHSKYNYCPICGAKMDLEEQHDD